MALNPRTTNLFNDNNSQKGKKLGGDGGGSGFSSAAKAQGVKTGIGLIQEGFRDITDFPGRIGISKDVLFAGELEAVKGKQESAATIEAFNDVAAANIVASFASGILLQGSAATVQQELASKASFSIGISNANARIKSLALKREGNRLRAEAKFKKKMAPYKIVVGGVIAYFSAGQL